MTYTDVVRKSASTEARPAGGDLAALAGVLCLALAARLVLMRLPGYAVDLTLFTEWTVGLLTIPWGDYYGLVSPWCDYPPGYLYVLAATGWLKAVATGSTTLTLQDFEPWIKAGPILMDLVLGLAVYFACRRFVGAGRSLLAASIVLLNPSVMLVSAVWGQADSIPSAFYVLALLSMVSGAPIWAAVWAALGFVTKPQYGVFLAAIGVGYLRWAAGRSRGRVGTGIPSVRSDAPDADGPAPDNGAPRLRRWWASDDPPRGGGTPLRLLEHVVAPLVVLIGLIQMLLKPFSVSLWPSPAVEWAFLERVEMAVEEGGDFASSGAFNLWGTQIAGVRQLDSIQGWLSLTYEAWGAVLFAALALFCLAMAWRESDRPEAVLWAAFLLALGLFELFTKMRERYLFVALPLLAMLVAFRPRLVLYYAAISALYFVNVWYMWTYGADVHADVALIQRASEASVVLFGIGLACATWIVWLSRGAGSKGSGLWSDAAGLEDRPGRLRRSSAGLPSREWTRRVRSWSAAVALVLLVGAVVGDEVRAFANQQGAGPVRVTTVRAYREAWQDTGVRVDEGERISIAAQGKWTHRAEGDLYGPAGNGDVVDWTIVPSAPIGALLGRIGDSEPFVVGDGVTFVASGSGPLELRMNDGRRGYEDNRGKLKVAVKLGERAERGENDAPDS